MICRLINRIKAAIHVPLLVSSESMFGNSNSFEEEYAASGDEKEEKSVVSRRIKVKIVDNRVVWVDRMAIAMRSLKPSDG